jgi:hypothetical protein
MNGQIPATAHFVWLGRDLPWVYGLALRSAAARGGFERVVLHCTDDVSGSDGFTLACDDERVESRRLDPRSALWWVSPRGGDLVELYSRLRQPAAKSNMLRLAILAAEGGVYLDTDTITVASFSPLLGAGVFCGLERIALPAATRRARTPGPWVKAGARILVRDLLRRAPGGWQGFALIAEHYPAAANNAVLGARPGHPLIQGMLERMVDLPPERQLARFALGTGLLQDAVDSYDGDDLELHPPERFYPLSPEISEHWFRIGERAPLDAIVARSTVCIHWYASVRTKRILPRIGASYLRANAHRQLFSAAALPLIDR